MTSNGEVMMAVLIMDGLIESISIIKYDDCLFERPLLTHGGH